MKVKSLLALTLIAASTSAFSMNIVHGKLISHKEWTTNNTIKGIATDIKIDARQFKKFIHKNSTGYSQTISFTRLGKIPSPVVGQATTLSSMAHTLVYNDTDEKKIYYITSQLCTDTLPDSGAGEVCYMKSDMIELETQGSIDMGANLAFDYTYQQAGDYDISTETFINHTSPSFQEQYASSSVDYFTLTVSGNKK